MGMKGGRFEKKRSIRGVRVDLNGATRLKAVNVEHFHKSEPKPL